MRDEFGTYACSTSIVQHCSCTRKISAAGLDAGTCWLALFDQANAEELAQKIKSGILNKEAFIEQQGRFEKALYEYKWEEAAQKYYDIDASGARQMKVGWLSDRGSSARPVGMWMYPGPLRKRDPGLRNDAL